MLKVDLDKDWFTIYVYIYCYIKVFLNYYFVIFYSVTYVPFLLLVFKYKFSLSFNMYKVNSS